MSTAFVNGFSSSKVQQENRLKSRKQSRQSGLKPQNRQTEGEFRGGSKRYNSTPLVTPRRALTELSNNVKATPRQSDSKCQGHTAVNLPPSSTKRQGASVPRKANEVEKLPKSVSEFPDIEFQPNFTTPSSGIESPSVTPYYFKELSLALSHTTYMPLTLQDPPQPPVLSLSVPRRPLSNHVELVTMPEDDLGSTSDAILLDLPEFDF